MVQKTQTNEAPTVLAEETAEYRTHPKVCYRIPFHSEKAHLEWQEGCLPLKDRSEINRAAEEFLHTALGIKSPDLRVEKILEVIHAGPIYNLNCI